VPFYLCSTLVFNTFCLYCRSCVYISFLVLACARSTADMYL
jgi:hypothetical protein